MTDYGVKKTFTFASLSLAIPIRTIYLIVMVVFSSYSIHFSKRVNRIVKLCSPKIIQPTNTMMLENKTKAQHHKEQPSFVSNLEINNLSLFKL
ncbi:CLUMA_CG001907, isoform A [Clunio marinus]|uniref:CLUMA_CG001907, isoform A n=1 Tax=Clunio marinus TaxID=568069 RepID=A0A1J1HKR1_9DIPT|nr:CLUMA_CG001907, isoform A [Clunio marinus]